MPTTSTATEALASTLVILAADYVAAVRPIDTRVAKATLDGACRAAAALGVGGGTTPAGIFLIALDYAKANTRPTIPANHRTWLATGIATVTATLDAGL